MREEENLRTIDDMQRAMDIKKVTNKTLLDNLTTQNALFKDELDLIGRQMTMMKKKPPQNSSRGRAKMSRNAGNKSLKALQSNRDDGG